MIYAFLSQKGGVGKTTLSIHLADALARRGSRVLLIDADPQQSAMKWSTFRAGENKFSVIAMAKPTLHKELPPISADYIDVVIDGPPRVHELAKSIILAADLVLIPVQPSPPDVWATAETVDLVNEARFFKETLISVIAINRKIVNTVIGRDVREALSALTAHIGVPKCVDAEYGRLFNAVLVAAFGEPCPPTHTLKDGVCVEIDGEEINNE